MCNEASQYYNTWAAVFNYSLENTLLHTVVMHRNGNATNAQASAYVQGVISHLVW